jgi:hypothetical protein
MTAHTLQNIGTERVKVMERSFEYDAFGPWIYEIDEEQEIPRLFRSCYSEAGSPLLLFKVPRKIDRRAASPNMDLYDYLVGAFDTYVHIWIRAGKNVVEKRINYGDVFAVRDAHALLKGELTLYTESEPVIIDYNTVSEDVISKLINIVESKISNPLRKLGTRDIPVRMYKNDPRSIDMLYFNLLNKLKQVNPDNILAAYQPRIYTQAAETQEPFWFDIKHALEFKQKLKDRVLSRYALVVNDNELIILEKETPKRNNRKEGFGHSYLYVPLQNITGALVYCFDEWYGLSTVEIRTGSKTFEYICESVNMDIRNLCSELNRLNGESVV